MWSSQVQLDTLYRATHSVTNLFAKYLPKKPVQVDTVSERLQKMLEDEDDKYVVMYDETIKGTVADVLMDILMNSTTIDSTEFRKWKVLRKKMNVEEFVTSLHDALQEKP